MNEDEKRRERTRISNLYNKKHLKKFQTNVSPAVMERIETYCKWAGINKAEFLRRAIETLD